MIQPVLTLPEKIVFALRGLYEQYGYQQFRMSKFEEYDLYARNKDFLISDSVITFTDTNGKLMALKPDVTLSIVKNSRDQENTLQKLYYNENVYRVSRGALGFRELMQVGLECLGNVDTHCLAEVLTLAAKSLLTISSGSILDLSHLGLLDRLLAQTGVSEAVKKQLLQCVGEKNLHELRRICAENGVSEEKTGLLLEIASLRGTPAAVLPRLEVLLQKENCQEQLEQLKAVTAFLEGTDAAGHLFLDFSVVDDIHYYNGIVFKGFVPGLPNAVLSGGQYDALMRRMKRRSCAVGFAVYMDQLERLEPETEVYDVDVVLLYRSTDPVALVAAQADQLRRQGLRVTAQQAIPESIRYRTLMRMQGEEVETLENHA